MNAKLPDIAMTNNVYARLNDARAEFHTLKLKKSGHNKFAGYNYFELGDFLIPALEVFRKHNLSAVVSFTNELASMTIRCIDNPSDMIVITSPFSSAALKGCHEVQNVGAVETYQRRYLWVAALEIVEHDALDATTGKEAPKRMESSKSVAKAELEQFSEEEQAFLKEQAMEVLSLLPDEVAMYERYEEIKKSLDSDEQVAWWSFFDSKSRSALKKGKDLMMAAAS